MKTFSNYILEYLLEALNPNDSLSSIKNFIFNVLKTANIQGFILSNKADAVSKSQHHSGQIRVFCNKDVTDATLDNVNNYITQKSNNSIIITKSNSVGSARYTALYDILVANMTEINPKISGKYSCTLLYTKLADTNMITTNDGKKLLIDISNAEFTPQKFGIQPHKPYFRAELYTKVFLAIKNAPANSNIVLFEKYLLDVLKKALNNDSNVTSGDSPHSNDTNCNVLKLNEITQEHINKINKGFGEITCALRTLYNIGKEGYGGSTVTYPVEGNGIWDFKLTYGKKGITNERFYSVKNRGLSSSTAMSNILSMLIEFEDKEEPSALDSDYQLFKKCIITLSANAKGIPTIKANSRLAIDLNLDNRNTGKCSIDAANIYAPNSNKLTKLLDIFKKIFGISDTSYETFKSCLIKCQTSDEALNTYSEELYKFYNSITPYNTKSEFGINTSVSVNTVKKIRNQLKLGIKAFGFIIEPICKIFVQELNNNKKMINYLNRVLSSNGGKIFQIDTNISIKNGKVNYVIDEKDIKNFVLNNFIFYSHGRRMDDGNNVSVGFKMVEDENSNIKPYMNFGYISIIHNTDDTEKEIF